VCVCVCSCVCLHVFVYSVADGLFQQEKYENESAELYAPRLALSFARALLLS